MSNNLKYYSKWVTLGCYVLAEHGANSGGDKEACPRWVPLCLPPIFLQFLSWPLVPSLYKCLGPKQNSLNFRDETYIFSLFFIIFWHVKKKKIRVISKRLDLKVCAEVIGFESNLGQPDSNSNSNNPDPLGDVFSTYGGFEMCVGIVSPDSHLPRLYIYVLKENLGLWGLLVLYYWIYVLFYFKIWFFLWFKLLYCYA